MDQNKDEKLSKVLKYVDNFAELYVDAVLRWMEKEKIEATKVIFMLGKAPYKFPPKIVIKKDTEKQIVYSFQLLYANETNYAADCYASDINQFIEENPDDAQIIFERLKKHLRRVRENK